MISAARSESSADSSSAGESPVDGPQERVVEAAADHGADLRDLLAGREAVETRRQQVLQSRRDLRGASEARLLDDEADELLGEEGNAVGAARDLRQLAVGRRGAASREAPHELVRLRGRQAIEADRRVMRPRRPRVYETRPRRADHEQRDARALDRQELQQLARRGIRPVDVLQHEHERPLAGEARDHGAQRPEELPAPVRGRLRSASRRRLRFERKLEPEKVRQQGQRGLGLDPRGGEERLEARPLLGGARVALPAEPLAERLDHREERRVLEEGRGAAFDPAMGRRALRQLLRERVQETRLPDPRVADQPDELPRAGTRALPALEQKPALGLAPDEGSRPVRGVFFDASPRAARPEDAVEDEHLLDALHGVLFRSRCHEQARDELVRRRRDRQAVRLGQLLHSRRDVRGLAEDRARRAPRALVDDDPTRMDPDARRELERAIRETEVQLADGVEDREPRAHGALRVVAVRLGVAEVGEHAVAEVLRDVSAEAQHRRLGRVVKRAHHVAPLLGIEAPAERRGADEVREDHADLAPLSARRRLAGARTLARRGLARLSEARSAGAAEAGVFGGGSTARRTGSIQTAARSARRSARRPRSGARSRCTAS